MLCGRMIAGIDKKCIAILWCNWLTWRKPAGFAVGLLSVWALAEVWSETWLFGCGTNVESNLKVAKQSLFSNYFLFSLFKSFHKANVPLYQSEIAPPDCCCQCLSSRDVSSFEMVAARHMREHLRFHALCPRQTEGSPVATLAGAEGGNCILVPALLSENLWQHLGHRSWKFLPNPSKGWILCKDPLAV